MKWLALIFIFFFINSVKTDCVEISWGGIGAYCNDTTNQVCKNFLTCQHNVCKPGYIGAKCSHDSDCYLSHLDHVKCVENVCNTLKYNGEHCDSNDECYSRICHFGFCAGRALGFPCDSKAPVQCAEKLYCSKKTNKCENILHVNDNCQDYHETRPGDNYYIMCPPGTACFSETCELIGSKGIGEECNFDSECVGLFKCYASSQNETKICQGYEALQSCGENTTCSLTNGEFCICDHSNNKTEGVCKVSDAGQVACGYAEVAKEYQQCWKENGCPLDLYQKIYGTLSFFTESIPNGSCMSEKCGHILKKLFLLCESNDQESST